MIDVRGKRVLVVGLARSGYSIAKVLNQHGAIVTITDLRPPSAFAAMLPELVGLKIGLELGSQREETFLRHDLIVVSPGVPWDLPQLKAARDRKIPVVPEIEAADWYLEGCLIGVTGSNGKTTTTTLMGKMFEASGFPTFVGGNIGVPLSAAAGKTTPDSILVTELSSFQLESIQEFRPDVAVFLNLSPNHLDRHPSLEAYAAAKRQIFRNQQPEDVAILNADDPYVAGLAPTLISRKVFFSRQQSLMSGVFTAEGRVIYRTGHLERALFDISDVQLRGAFNLENVLAATAAACVLGADFSAIREVVREFRGVEHRLEFVRKIRGIEFYNNSKATSVDATKKSLEAFERGVHLIMGGKDKGAPYAPLRPLLENRVQEIVLIGAAADRIASELSGAVKLIRAGDLATAVREAFRRAVPGEVVLLAPACSSFDQFQDYEQRGRVFKELVQNLAKEVLAEGGEWGARPERPRPRQAPAVAPPERESAVRSASPTLPADLGVGSQPVHPLEKGPQEAKIETAHPPLEEHAMSRPIATEPAPAPAPQEVVPESSADEPETEEPSEVSSAPEPETSRESNPEARPAGNEDSDEKDAQDSGFKASGENPAISEPAEPFHELQYMYEVGAEEMPKTDVEPAAQYEDDNVPTVKASEVVEDDPLPFEARAASEATGEKRELRDADSRAQAHLPGIE